MAQLLKYLFLYHIPTVDDVMSAITEEWEAKQASRQKDTSDLIKEKHRLADLEKKKKLAAFDKQAATHKESKHLDLAEQQLKEKVHIIGYHQHNVISY